MEALKSEKNDLKSKLKDMCQNKKKANDGIGGKKEYDRHLRNQK